MTTFCFWWFTVKIVIGSGVGIYRSLGGEYPGWLRNAQIGQTVGSRMRCLAIDVVDIYASFVVLSLAWQYKP